MKSKVIPIIVGLALVLAACARSEGASGGVGSSTPLSTHPAKIATPSQTLTISGQTSGPSAISILPIAKAQAVPRALWGPPTAPVLFNPIDDLTSSVPISDDVDALVLSLYSFDPTTGVTTLIDKDAMLEDSDPISGRVLVRSESGASKLRVLDLSNQSQVGELPVDPLAAGCLMPDGEVLAFSDGSVLRWNPDNGISGEIAKASDLGLTTDVDKAVCRGPEVAALDHNGVLVVLDTDTLASSVLSKTADPNADPAMAWVGTSLYWVQSDYPAHTFGLAAYDISSGTGSTEDFSGLGFGFMASGIAPWGSAEVLVVRGMLGTGFSLSELVTDKPGDRSTSDQAPLNIKHAANVAILHAYPSADSKEILVIVDEPSASASDLYLVVVQ